jgi:hypothetical protein
MGQARSHMTDFFYRLLLKRLLQKQKEFCFDFALCQKTPHCAESRLRAKPHRAELLLRAMPPSVKFKSTIFLPTPRYVAQRGFDSALCRIAGSRRVVTSRFAA